jgi:hypothetical protein
MTRLHVVATVPLTAAGGRLAALVTSTAVLLQPHGFIALRNMIPHELQVQRTGDPEGPRERLTSLGEVETLGHRVQMRPAARRPMIGIREDKPSGNRHPQQASRTGPLPAPDAGALPGLTRARFHRHCHVNLGVWLRLSRPTERSVYLLVITSHIRIRPDVDPPAGEAGGEAGVLPFFADRERELIVGYDDPRGAGRGVDDLN